MNVLPEHCLMETIYGFVDQHAERNSESLAILAAGRPPLTYGRLDSQIRYVGEGLSRAGVWARDRVAVVLPDGAEAAVAIVAVAARAACAPLNPPRQRRCHHELDLLAAGGDACRALGRGVELV